MESCSISALLWSVSNPIIATWPRRGPFLEGGLLVRNNVDDYASQIRNEPRLTTCTPYGTLGLPRSSAVGLAIRRKRRPLLPATTSSMPGFGRDGGCMYCRPLTPGWTWPNCIGIHASQQLAVDVVPWSRLDGPRLPTDGGQPHGPHQTLGQLPEHPVTLLVGREHSALSIVRRAPCRASGD